MSQLMNSYVDKFNESLKQTKLDPVVDTKLEESMRYSLSAGGKRIRPVLLLMTLSMLKCDIKKGLETAKALEMIHTYSLIHDDLPAMDNDDYRRGMKTNHKVYGDATAILAGDALLTKAFELITKDTYIASDDKVKLIRLLSESAGHQGMVGGQVLDMDSEDKEISLDTLRKIHRYKTGALIRFSVVAACTIAKVSSKTFLLLDSFSQELGLIFQIKDDLLDIEGDFDKIGKSVGSDEINNKSTYVSLLGKTNTKVALEQHVNQALYLLEQLEEQYDTDELKSLTQLFANREN
ncbi:polyprenyl synthetase family protein [Mammaliicoccus vitulinus]|uniref:polyprenyl synthetase family protein n=1 Tax=Mammaliicoccus vitulinus TaxID=71237 RepID=UPI0002D6C3D8|nr:farnesyl diphosphate synthase [Mammaliicoccus vitulinus]MBM6628158.1 polyprenyl synthetase family protein [Mammaliicoccus vitulinus]MBO3077183.1 polyprenyl synthetase family protein [Mammaliicoccus vitulinus]MEB7656851.1 polyprenyl synthetase family protein [Mammaliicoccus vitulinus]